MKKWIKIAALFIPSCCLYINIFCQELISPIDSLAGSLIKKIRRAETQQAIIVTDKTIYSMSENLWYKVFLLHSISHKISRDTRKLYLQLTNLNDSVIKTFLLDVKESPMTGKIQLNDSLPAGKYFLTAFTSQMNEQDSLHSFTLPLYLVNPAHPTLTLYKEDIIQRFVPPLDISFYPEGGALITGAVSRVGIKIKDFMGKPVQMSCILKDNRDSILDHFQTNEWGMASVHFYPYRYRKYSIYIKEMGREWPLPPFNFFKAQLSLQKDAYTSNLRVVLEDSIYSPKFVTYIIGISKDSLCFVSRGVGNYEVMLPEDHFPNGIAHLFLLDDNLKLLSERSIYIKNNSIRLDAQTDQVIYKKRQKVILDLAVNGPGNMNVPSLLCISVCDSSFVQLGQLINPIKNPFQKLADPFLLNSLFRNADDLSNEQMDLLMLCQYVIFSDIKQLKPIGKNLIDDSLIRIQGRVFNKRGAPLKNKVVTFFAGGLQSILESDTTNDQGYFQFFFKSISNDVPFSLQISNAKGTPEEDSIYIEKEPLPKWNHQTFARQPIKGITFSNNLNFYFDSLKWISKGYLKPVVVRANRKKQVDYDETKRISRFSQIITSDKFDMGGYGTVANSLFMIPGVHMVSGYLIVGGVRGFKLDYKSEPLIIIDGVEYDREILRKNELLSPTGSVVMAFLNKLSTAAIDFIEVLTGPEAANYGVRGANGVIIINTKSRLKDMSHGNFIKIFKANGYEQSELFKYPDYSNKKLNEITKSDNRYMLFWNGNVILDNNKQTIEFYTSDMPGTYQINLYAITIHGDVLNKTIYFKVEN